MTPVHSRLQMGLVADGPCSYPMGPMKCFPSETTMNAWQEILGYIKTKVNTQSYQTWLRPTRFSHVSQEALVVRVPNREFQDWIQEHYGSLINEALAQLPLHLSKVQYVVEEDAEKKPMESGEGKAFQAKLDLSQSTIS